MLTEKDLELIHRIECEECGMTMTSPHPTTKEAIAFFVKRGWKSNREEGVVCSACSFRRPQPKAVAENTTYRVVYETVPTNTPNQVQFTAADFPPLVEAVEVYEEF